MPTSQSGPECPRGIVTSTVNVIGAVLLPIPMFIIEPDPEGQAEEQGQGDML